MAELKTTTPGPMALLSAIEAANVNDPECAAEFLIMYMSKHAQMMARQLVGRDRLKFCVQHIRQTEMRACGS